MFGQLSLIFSFLYCSFSIMYIGKVNYFIRDRYVFLDKGLSDINK